MLLLARISTTRKSLFLFHEFPCVSIRHSCLQAMRGFREMAHKMQMDLSRHFSFIVPVDPLSLARGKNIMYALAFPRVYRAQSGSLPCKN